MDANFFHYSIYDRFIQRQPCACIHACVHLLTLTLKKTSQKQLTGLLQNLLFVTEKSGLWSDTGAQGPLVIILSRSSNKAHFDILLALHFQRAHRGIIVRALLSYAPSLT